MQVEVQTATRGLVRHTHDTAMRARPRALRSLPLVLLVMTSYHIHVR